MNENNKSINENQDSKYYNTLLNNIAKYIDSNNDTSITKNNNNNNNLLNEKIKIKLEEINNKGIDICLIKDNFNNTLIQFYANKDYNNTVDIISMIINYYYTVLLNNNKDKFDKWLINENLDHFNIFELLIEKQFSLNKQIYIFNNLFNYFNSRDNLLINRIIYNRNNNIFHLCIKQNNIPLLLVLFEKLKNFFPNTNVLDVKNNEGMTPLHLSCFYLYKAATDNLLLLGCNINEKDKRGNTPLHYAVNGENFNLTKKLILFGAEKNTRNNEYLSPKDLARKNGNFSIRKLFNKSLFNQISSIKNKKRENILFILIVISLFIKLFFFIQKDKSTYDFIFFVYLCSFIFDMFCCGFIFYPKICNKKLYKKKVQRMIIIYYIDK